MKGTNYSNCALASRPLAALNAPDRGQSDDVVRMLRLPPPRVVRIVRELGRAGCLETVRGRWRDFRLARLADPIATGDRVRMTEGPLALVVCFPPRMTTRPPVVSCRGSRTLQTAAKAFMAVLGDLALADSASNKGVQPARIAAIDRGTVAPIWNVQ